MPPKLAANVKLPKVDGVRLQLPTPLASVIALQNWLPTVRLTVTPVTGSAGVTEISSSVAESVVWVPTVPPVGLGLRLIEVTCSPAFHVTFAIVEVNVMAPTVADAMMRSSPTFAPT